MNVEPASRPPADAPHRPEVFRHPIEFFLAEHDRQRVVCAALERLANDTAAADARDNAAFVLNHLENDLRLHVADEEEDLFPLLKRRCPPDDELDYVVTLLNEEHGTDEAYHLRLLDPLRAIVEGLQPPDRGAFVHDARAFAIFQRRHLGWENGTVLPLARKRLTDADQAELGRRMAARRGISLAG